MKAYVTGLALVCLFGCAPRAEEPAPTPAPTPAGPAIQTEEVEYSAGEVTMKGFLAWDANAPGPRPGVLVVHEWWGHNDYARQRARQLAELGYTALAVDMYGAGKRAEHPEDAGKFAQEVMKNVESAEARFEAAHELLDAHATTDPAKTAAIGYCFGGGVVLHMARAGSDLAGVASFHGSLPGEAVAKPEAVKAKVLVLHGAADPFVTAEQIAAFKKSMDEAQIDYRFVAYEGAKHSFTSPEADALGEKFDLPLAYDAAADEQSWQAMQEFFEEIFATPTPEEGHQAEAASGAE